MYACKYTLEILAFWRIFSGLHEQAHRRYFDLDGRGIKRLGELINTRISKGSHVIVQLSPTHEMKIRSVALIAEIAPKSKPSRLTYTPVDVSMPGERFL